MATEYEVRYEREALSALEETVRFIREDAGTGRAAAWLRAMRSGIGELETLPRAFAIVGWSRGQAVYSKLVLTHRVFYYIQEATQTVFIIDIVHTSRESQLAKYRDPPEE